LGEKKLIADQTLKVTIETKKKLDSIKIHPRETVDDLINRLFKFRDWMADTKKHSEKEDLIDNWEKILDELRAIWQYL